MPAHCAARVLAAVVLVTAMTAACSATDAGSRPPSTVTIGVLTAAGEAGDDPAGAAAVRGAQLAAAVVNEVFTDLALPLAEGAGLPALADARLAIAVGDTAGGPDSADAAMGELVDEHRVAGVVSTERAGVVAIAGAYADRRELPMVDATSTAGYLLDIGLDWYFRTGPSDRMLIDAVFALVPARSAGIGPTRRVTVLLPTEDRGADTAVLVRDQAAAAGFAVTGDVSAETGPDPDDQTSDETGFDPDGLPAAGPGDLLLRHSPDVVVAVAPAAEDVPPLLRALTEWEAAVESSLLFPVPGLPAPEPPPRALVVGLGPGFAAPPADTELPPELAYATAWSTELAQRQPLARQVAVLYQERFQEPMTEPAARAFTATMMLAMAADSAGGVDPAAMRAALRQLSIPATQTIMPWHGIRFDENGQNQLAAAVVEQTGELGTRLVYPPEMATADLIWDDAGSQAEDQPGNQADDQPGDQAENQPGDQADDQPGDQG